MESTENKSDDIKLSKGKVKKLYTKIRKQMEFYFSDSNLVKDKFLMDLISKDSNGYVDLDIFITFNKIKALTNSTEMIASAVSRSNVFEISADQKRVRRVTPIKISKDFDACTLYVERLPPSADHKWIKDVFGQFGNIQYINVPRYKVTSKIKGFAFVEFENPDCVKSACEFYKLTTDKDCPTSEDESKNVKKRKHDEKDENDKKNKRKKTTSETSENTHNEELNVSEVEENKTSETEENKSIEESKNKRKRRNAKKHRLHTEKPALRVMSKSEWKVYRNKYLELQRSTMSVIKKQILLEMQELKEQETSNKSIEVHEPKKCLQFQPCVIVKVTLREPVKNSTDIKDQVKANAVVAYVDAPINNTCIYIRCHTSEDAVAVIREDKLFQLGKAELLKGEEESKYWDKIANDRKIKFSNPIPHKKRGRDKIIAKAAKLEEMKNKHIYFDE